MPNESKLSIEHLVNERRIVLEISTRMGRSFEKKLEKTFKFIEYEMSLYALGLPINAEPMHHYVLIKERYILLGDLNRKQQE